MKLPSVISLSFFPLSTVVHPYTLHPSFFSPPFATALTSFSLCLPFNPEHFPNTFLLLSLFVHISLFYPHIFPPSLLIPHLPAFLRSFLTSAHFYFCSFLFLHTFYRSLLNSCYLQSSTLILSSLTSYSMRSTAPRSYINAEGLIIVA